MSPNDVKPDARDAGGGSDGASDTDALRGESLLERAILLAREAHTGQVDKGGKPYIEHPLRVMETVRTIGAEAMMVAVLHDVVEDTWVTLAELRRLGFPPSVVAGVDAMSRRPGEGYNAYITRCCKDPLGLAVKRADLVDNMDPRRAFRGNESLMVRYRETVRYLDGLR